MTEQEARTEAYKRYDGDRIVSEITGEEESHDDYGYADTARQAFIAGAAWERVRHSSRVVVAAPSDTDQEVLIARIQREMESYDPETLGDDPAVFDSWNLMYDLKVALSRASQPVQVEVTDEMVERAARAVHDRRLLLQAWGDLPVDVQAEYLADAGAALTAALGGGE